jgi:hypothetical protein
MMRFLLAIIIFTLSPSLFAEVTDSMEGANPAALCFSSCYVTNRTGQVNALCGNQHPIRCYATANVTFCDGGEGQIIKYGQSCYKKVTDCFAGHPGAVDPCK